MGTAVNREVLPCLLDIMKSVTDDRAVMQLRCESSYTGSRTCVLLATRATCVAPSAIDWTSCVGGSVCKAHGDSRRSLYM